MVTPDQVAQQLTQLGVAVGAPVAVAVSGGADSLALLLLMHRQFSVTALSVNHGLREEAAGELEHVASICAAHGIPHIGLVWEGEKPESNLQAAARDARYNLMANWCNENRVSYLALGHHRDDQAETVMLRLARGSGVYGLAGMSSTRELDNVLLVRPLLDVPKHALRTFLKKLDIDWIEDPSNHSDAFDRVKVRRWLENPLLEGFTTERLAATAARLRRSRDALEFYEARWLERAVRAFPEGYALLSLSELAGEPDEILLRGLSSLCRFAGKGAYVPRMEKTERLLAALLSGAFAGQTLYGAQLTATGKQEVLISREIADCVDETSLEETCTWDNRFEITAKGDIAGLKIAALGEEGWRQLKASGFDVAEMKMPRIAALAVPAIFKGLDLQQVPQLGYSADESVSITVRPKRTILTKK